MKDLTKGFPAKVIILFAIPLIIGNIAQQLYNITDSKIVSLYVSSASLGAVGATAVVSNLLTGFLNGLTQGFAIMVSRHFGAHDMVRLRKTIYGFTVLTISFAVVLTIAGEFTVRPLLKLLGTPAEIMEDSVSYLQIILAGLIFSAIYNMSANILRAVGDSKRPLYCLLFAIVLNIGLDIYFVKVLNLGINGAAIATVIAQCICATMCVCIVLFKTREIVPGKAEWNLEKEGYRELITYGMSMGLMGSIVNVGTIVLQTGINGLGTTVLTAHIAARRVLDILMVMVYTIGLAMTTFASQNYGAGKIERIRKGVIQSVIADSIITTIILAVTFAYGTDVVCWIASSKDPEIVANGEMYLRYGVVFFYFLGPLFIFRCTLQGMGSKFVPLLTSTMELVIKILSVLFLVPAMGYLGVALTEPISWVVMSLCLLVGIAVAFKNPMCPR